MAAPLGIEDLDPIYLDSDCEESVKPDETNGPTVQETTEETNGPTGQQRKDSNTIGIEKFLAEIKCKTMCVHQTSTKKKKKQGYDKSDKEEKQCKRNSSNKPVSAKKKLPKSSKNRYKIAEDSNNSSNRSFKRLKSGKIVGPKNLDHSNDEEPDMERKRSHRRSRSGSSVHRSTGSSDSRSYYRHRSPARCNFDSPTCDKSFKRNRSLESSKRSSKRRISKKRRCASMSRSPDTNRRSIRKHARYARKSPTHGHHTKRYSPSPSNIYRWSPKSRSHSPLSSPDVAPYRRRPRNDSSSIYRWSPKNRSRSPSSSPDVAPYRRRSPTVTSTRLKYKSVVQSWLSKCPDTISPDKLRVPKSPIREKKKKISPHSPVGVVPSSSRSPDESSVPVRKLVKSEKENYPVKQEPVSDEESVPQPKDQVPQTQFIKSENIKTEFPEEKRGLLNNYYCQACQIPLTSEITWKSHINGKTHAKRLKSFTVNEIAKGGIEIPSTPATVSENIPRFAAAPAGKKRIPVKDEAKLQRTVDGIKDPIPGLNYVIEIISEKQINYYCQICDAPCGPTSIMPHLIGQKHRIASLKKICRNFFEASGQAKRIFAKHERTHGRGRIKVFREVDDPTTRPVYELQNWSHSSYPEVKQEKKEDGEKDILNDKFLDTSKGGFFCKICDSHMNNIMMWEAHVKGKRHLMNTRKIPGEISKPKSVKMPNAPSKLDELLQEEKYKDDIIVGLDFIKETKTINGEIFNCFLCGSCSTNYDIVDHILLPKHRLRYLEKLVTDGKDNNVTAISRMEFKEQWFRETLVDAECCKMVEKYGRGKAEVYMSKN